MDLLGIAREHVTLEQVVRWAVGTGRAIAGVVKQDEYTQDVVVAAGEGSWLVYDCT